MNKFLSFIQRSYTLLWLGAIAVIVITTLEFIHDGAENYIDYRDATLNFFHGISSYTPEYVAEHGRFYIYSPVFHYLFAPFAFLPFYIGGYLWNLLSWVAFFFAIKTLPGDLSERTTALTGYLLLLAMQCIFCFQFNLLVCSIFLFAFTLLEREHPFWAVLLIMFSATTKIYGAIELALLLCYPKCWRNIGYAVLCGIGLLLLPITQLGIDGFLPWYQDWLNELTCHTEHTGVYYSLVWAEPIQGLVLPHMRLFQGIVLAILAITFFVYKSMWTNYRFRVGALAALMIYIVLLSESAEYATHLISITGFALWYFLSKEHTIFEQVLLWLLFVLFVVMPIDLFCPSAWCNYVHKVLWLGVWTLTLAYGWLIFQTIHSNSSKQ